MGVHKLCDTSSSSLIEPLLNVYIESGRNVTTGVKLDVNYWSDRAADIVAIQLPLIVLLAGKNNIVSRAYVFVWSLRCLI
jgi:hypothetical protein